MGTQADVIKAALLKAIRQARNDTIVEVTANLMEPAAEGGTPVDTGWARANWIPSIGNATTAAIGTEGEPHSAQSAQQDGIVKVTTHAGPEPVFVTNNAPYIARLNDGWSKQAPSGFVDRAVSKAEATMQQLHATAQVDVTRTSVEVPHPPGAKK